MSIQLILGCMFSGKTTALLKEYKLNRLRGNRCVIVRFESDNRYTTTGVATHDLLVQDTDVISCGSKLTDVVDKLTTDTDVVLIDEGQFYTDIVGVVEQLANLGKTVIISGLDGSYERTRLGTLLDLIPKAEKIKKLHAVCMGCGGKASFTKLKLQTQSQSLINIGGSDKYVAVCRKCWLKK